MVRSHTFNHACALKPLSDCKLGAKSAAQLAGTILEGNFAHIEKSSLGHKAWTI